MLWRRVVTLRVQPGLTVRGLPSQELHLTRSYAKYALANTEPGTEDQHWITITCHQHDVVRQVMNTFATSGMRANIRVRFVGGHVGAGGHAGAGAGAVDVDGDGLADVSADGAHMAGVGEGWLLGEMFSQFFAGVVDPRTRLFETCLQRSGPAAAVAAHGVAKARAKDAWRLSGTAGADVVYLPSAEASDEVCCPPPPTPVLAVVRGCAMRLLTRAERARWRVGNRRRRWATCTRLGVCLRRACCAGAASAATLPPRCGSTFPVSASTCTTCGRSIRHWLARSGASPCYHM